MGMISDTISNSSLVENVLQSALVPMDKELSYSISETSIPDKESRDDATDESSVTSGSQTGKQSNGSRGSSFATDSEGNTIGWDATIAQLLYPHHITCIHSTRITTFIHTRYDSSADGVVIITQDCMIKSLNMSAQHMFGYFPKEVIGHNISLLLPKHYRKQFQAIITEIIQNTRPGDLEEVREGYPFSILTISFYFSFSFSFSFCTSSPLALLLLHSTSMISHSLVPYCFTLSSPLCLYDHNRYCERKAGDAFIATLRIVNNLVSTTSDPGK